MTVDLACLVINALWGAALVFFEISQKTSVAGTKWNLGNRNDAPAFPERVERASRALANHKENFPLFLTAVLVVHLTGHAGRVSAIACIVYVSARAAYTVIYIAGIQGLRSAAYAVGLAATLVVMSQLVI